jgi:hypothetical protein
MVRVERLQAPTSIARGARLWCILSYIFGVRRWGMGSARDMLVILTLIAWFGSLIALVVLLVLLRRSLRADRYSPRPRVRTIDRLRAAARWANWGPQTVDRLPGTIRQDTAYRQGTVYPTTQRVPRPPVDMPRQGRRADARPPSVAPVDWSSDPDRRYRTLQSAKVVRQQPSSRNSPAWDESDQPQRPRNRRAPFDQ